MKPWPIVGAVVYGFALMGCAGIEAPGERRGFGSQVGLPSSWHQVGVAARQAALQPAVLWPLAGSAVVGLSGWDDDITDWASEEQPLFGSNAAKVSDVLVDVATAGVLLSGALAPADTTGDRLRGLGIEASAVLIAGGVTEGLKSITRRERPNGRGRNSLPSGHATRVAASSRFWQANLAHYSFGAPVERVSGVVLNTLSYATAWARVEANVHHPSDVLLGIAIGNFVAEFLRLSLLEGKSSRVTVGTNAAAAEGLAVEMVPRGAVLRFRHSLGGRAQPKVWR